MAGKKNANLHRMLDDLVAALQEHGQPAGFVSFTLKDGTECALALSLDSKATMGLDIWKHVAADEGVGILDGQAELEDYN
jgi:hypothetical protein